ncbi:MAG: T9SS type A sorting domain-containing protein [Candidatus Eisenbacteria bacterium]|nr:T9SS type A sorting domain-containing protein [Candidatus Eisenbacteria bacterium]
MRTILILVLAMAALSVAARATHEIESFVSSEIGSPEREATPRIVATAEIDEGRTSLIVRDESSAPFERPFTQLVVIPADASEIEVGVVAQAGEDPGVEAAAGTPMIARGARILPVAISRTKAAGEASAHLAGKGAPSEVRIEIRYRETPRGSARARPSAALRRSRGFFTAMAPYIAPEQLASLASEETGSYVIVTHPDFLSAIEPFAEWKTQMGFEVLLLTTNEAGGTNTAIKAYLQNLYDTSANPPQYLLLVGDIAQVPSFSFHSNVTDHPYTLMEGNDFMPDLGVGRFSVASLVEAQTVVAKVLNYERNPYKDEGTDWFSRALLVAGDYGSTTPVAVSKWCRSLLIDMGFANVDSCYFPPFFIDHQRRIPNAINRGVSIVSYRGWAYGTNGWEPPHFTVDEIPSLANGWKLPVVCSWVCQNNDFSKPECFGEKWLRAGTQVEPKGAVAFIGNSEPWSHTRFNDACAIGAFKGIRHGGVRRMTDLLNAAKLECLYQFPDAIDYQSSAGESVELNYYIYSLLGDPEMEMFLNPPRPIAVTHVARVAEGSNFLQVQVLDAAGQTAIAGARVGIAQGRNLLGCAWTDADGTARVPAEFAAAGTPTVVTVTGTSLDPYQGGVEVFSTTEGSFFGYGESSLDDDAQGSSSGNGDGLVNPGETIELTVTLRNHGGRAGSGISATIAAIETAEIVQAQSAFPDIPPSGQGTCLTPFVLRVPAQATDGQRVRIALDATAQGFPPGGASRSIIDLEVAAPALRYHAYSAAGAGGLDPGRTVDLSITLRNDGSANASRASAALTTSTPDFVTVIDGETAFPPIAIGEAGTSETAFRIQIDDEAAVGQAAVFTLVLTTAEGYIGSTSFSLAIGTVDHGAPLGPDVYGYYAYDSTDTDYPSQAPTYRWIECSPVYGGSGTLIPLTDNTTATVDLPFSFTYYGESFNSVVVCDNGWLSFEMTTYYDYYNWHIPNAYGNGAQIAPFWDNLDPMRLLADIKAGDGIYRYHDPERHLFVIEWSRVMNWRPELDDLQTFEVIFYDPAHYPTASGNGIVEFQYKQVTNDDAERMFATVGIENMEEDIGLEYTYSNSYPAAAAPISSGLAIRFSTEKPRYDPFRIASFRVAPEAGGLMLAWEPADERPRGGYRIYRATGQGDYETVTESPLDAASRSYIDRSADPDSTYSYRVGSLDPFGRETLIGPFAYNGGNIRAPRFALEARTPNPFRGMLDLIYAIPRPSDVTLQIHDLSGRTVRTLIDGPIPEGSQTATWDGRDEDGRQMPSGIYLCTLTSGQQRRSLKLTLLR